MTTAQFYVLAGLLGGCLLLLAGIFRRLSKNAMSSEVIPLSTGVAVLPSKSAMITVRAQRRAFRPQRMFVSAAGTSGGAADWIVNDIKIAGQSQFAQAGDLPGDMFATSSIDSFVKFDVAKPLEDVQVVVTYIGTNPQGAPFYASLVGPRASRFAIRRRRS